MHRPPHCSEHPGRLYAAGCHACQAYRRYLANWRSRQRAYGTWHPFADPTPVRAHIAELVAGGMSLRQIAARAGLACAVVGRVHAGRNTLVRTETAECILGVQPVVVLPRLVDATGAARRLQALAIAGYGTGRLAGLVWPGSGHITSRRRHLASWRIPRRPTISVTFHDRIAHVYDELAGTYGGYSTAVRTALSYGWVPCDAWTDNTIDDPTALPYTDPEALQYVDWVKLNYARLPRGEKKRIPFTELTEAEQLHLLRQHVLAGGSQRGFRDRYRPVPAAVLRALVAAL